MTDSSAGSFGANSPSTASQTTGSPTTAGGGAPDVHEMLSSMRGELDSVRNSHRQTQAEARAAREQLQRIKNAVAPEESEEGEDESNRDQWFTSVLDKMLDAKTKGYEMPITSELAVALKESRDEVAELKKIINDYVKKTDHLADPSVAVDQRAYDQMDGFVGESLGAAFGGEYPPTIAKAVTSSIVGFLQELRQEAPEKWSEIRRDAKAQRKIVQHFVNSHIPQHLRQMSRDLAEARRPFTHGDAREALAEARQLKAEDRQKVMPHVRQKFWETMFERKRPQY